MIKPATLWGLFKGCDDDAWLGRVCRALGGQPVDLDFGQAQMVKSIKLDSGWMDERAEAKREEWRKRQAAHRALRAQDDQEASQTPESVTSVTCHESHECHEMSRVTQCHGISVLPSIPPSIHPSNPMNKINIPNRTDIEAMTMPEPADTGRVGINFKSMSDSDIYGYVGDTYSLYYAAFGKGMWAKAIAQLGDAVCRDLLVSYKHELAAGEYTGVRSHAAVMTKKIKRYMEDA